MLELIDQMKIFVLYAPRQSGKTTYLLALRDELNRAGRLHCIYFNAEVGHAAGEDTEAAMRAILGELAQAVKITLGDSFVEDEYLADLEKCSPFIIFGRVIGELANRSDKPLVCTD